MLHYIALQYIHNITEHYITLNYIKVPPKKIFKARMANWFDCLNNEKNRIISYSSRLMGQLRIFVIVHFQSHFIGLQILTPGQILLSMD